MPKLRGEAMSLPARNAPKSHAFPCPQCAGRTYVYHGRKSDGGYKRYRKCMACKITYQTLELEVEQ